MWWKKRESNKPEYRDTRDPVRGERIGTGTGPAPWAGHGDAIPEETGVDQEPGAQSHKHEKTGKDLRTGTTCHRDREQHRKREDKKSKRPDSSDPEITELHRLILRSCIIFNLQSSIRGESMEKTKTSLRPDNRSRQINLFAMGNITLYGTPGAVCKLCKRNRKGT